MKIALFLIILFLVLAPGILLLFGAIRFNTQARQIASGIVIAGGILILMQLLISGGTYYYSYFGNAEELAAYSLRTSLVGTTFQFLGLMAIAVGLLLYKKSN